MGHTFLECNTLNSLHPLTLNLLDSYQVVPGMKQERMTNTYLQSSLHFIHFIKKKQFLKFFLTTVTMHAVNLDVVSALKVGWDSSVSIATGYRLDSPGIESRRERDFPHLSRPALGPTQPHVRWVPGLSWG